MKTYWAMGFAVLCMLGTMGTAFAAPSGELIYQGVLSDSEGAPLADGLYDFRFSIWDAAQTGTSLWQEESQVTVSNGAIAAPLGALVPFPEGLFEDNTALYLEIQVDADNNGFEANEIFTPRTALRAVAFAKHAANAAQLGGLEADAYATSDDIDSVNTELSLLIDSAEAIQTSLAGIELNVTEITATQTALADALAELETDFAALEATVEGLASDPPSLVRVRPGATSSESGAALLAAVDGLVGPATVVVAPGVYELGNSTLVLPASVDLQGYGNGRSVLTKNLGTGLMVDVGSNGALRDIGLASSNAAGVTAVQVSGRIARLQNVGINLGNVGPGGTHVGLFMNDSANVTITNSIINVSGVSDGQGGFSGTAVGLQTQDASVNIRVCEISARNAGTTTGLLLVNGIDVRLDQTLVSVGNFGTGRGIDATTSVLRATGTRVEANGGQASSLSVGIQLTSGITTLLNSCTVSATANGGSRFAYDAIGTSAIIQSSSFTAPQGTAVRSGGGQLNLHHCILSGSTSLNGASGTVRAAACQLDGALAGLSTRFQCYDTNFNAVP